MCITGGIYRCGIEPIYRDEMSSLEVLTPDEKMKPADFVFHGCHPLVLKKRTASSNLLPIVTGFNKSMFTSDSRVVIILAAKRLLNRLI